MAQGSLISFIISSIINVVLFATFRFYGVWFTSSPFNTILCGFLGSWLFIFLLTAASNIEMVVFGNDFQAKFIPEIVVCLGTAVFACGLVHRVAATTCILFSIIGLYYLNRISQKAYSTTAVVEPLMVHKKSGAKKHK